MATDKAEAALEWANLIRKLAGKPPLVIAEDGETAVPVQEPQPKELLEEAGIEAD